MAPSGVYLCLSFMIIIQTSGEDIRSEEMFVIPDSKFQCANTTCLPFISVIITDIRNCRFACLAQSQCEAATFHRSTSNCELFGDMLNQNGNMLADADATTMIVISGTRFPPAPTTTSTPIASSSTSPLSAPSSITSSLTSPLSAPSSTTASLTSPLSVPSSTTSLLSTPSTTTLTTFPATTAIPKWTITGNMSGMRAYHTASIIANGSVLVAGGGSSVSTNLNTAELYNPSTGAWTITASMNGVREFHTASILTNGKVLVAGGLNSGGYLNGVELY
ncbi:unnamed protein product [Adineta steineri]|uniref:Apple domain-containing protein n=1 Tax=Adineta steineri TaxID=433720 RepID=A0A815SQP2_9BILA|nr:unnamed protein product [Adineta steineri]CAF4073257.1 unnamed protein product [Adineta steineri]